MNRQELVDTIKELTKDGKGLLAMDESTASCNARFEKAGIAATEEMRRDYRELIITTPGLSEYISGAILYDETIRQKGRDGIPLLEKLLKAGIIPGIKVDTGAKDLPFFPEEKITEGLDKLRERLIEYKKMGARFAKWRAVFQIGQEMPHYGCIAANVSALCRYAALCQESDIVPIVEPEVLMDGNHSLQKCFEVTEKVLKNLFYEIYLQRVDLACMILKPNMVLAGKDCPEQPTADKVAEATVECFLRSVPASVPAIAFLSGGQSPQLASERLNAMNARYKTKAPWKLTFSFSRAIQEPALSAWKGDSKNISKAQDLLKERARANSAATLGL